MEHCDLNVLMLAQMLHHMVQNLTLKHLGSCSCSWKIHPFFSNYSLPKYLNSHHLSYPYKTVWFFFFRFDSPDSTPPVQKDAKNSVLPSLSIFFLAFIMLRSDLAQLNWSQLPPIRHCGENTTTRGFKSQQKRLISFSGWAQACLCGDSQISA